MESDELVCFSTDYPHWDFDSPLEALPPDLDDSLKTKIFFDNAAAIYQRLPVHSAVPA
jgi:predicted TIM-barrel fold metal-dependent hydrolase